MGQRPMFRYQHHSIPSTNGATYSKKQIKIADLVERQRHSMREIAAK
jgi:hypothetical protein